jgi:hypothetical protein
VVNDSVGVATVVSVGDGVGFCALDAADPDGPAGAGGAAVGAGPHPVSTTVIIRAQPLSRHAL